MIVGHGALAGLRLCDRDPGLFGEAPQGICGFGVDRAPATDDHRSAGLPYDGGGALYHLRLRYRAADTPHPPLEKRHRIIVGLSLHVLRERERHRSGLSLVCEHTHR